LLIGSVFIYWNVSRPVLQFDGSEAVDLVRYGDHTSGSVKLVINGNGRLIVESIKLDLVGVTLQILGSYPTTMDLPAHFAVYVSTDNPNTGKGSRLTIHLAGSWLLLGSSTRVDLHGRTASHFARILDGRVHLDDLIFRQVDHVVVFEQHVINDSSEHGR
jgi:hypothetical protein